MALIETKAVPEPKKVDDRITRWGCVDGLVVADDRPNGRGVYLYGKDPDGGDRTVLDPEQLAKTLLAAKAVLTQKQAERERLGGIE